MLALIKPWESVWHLGSCRLYTVSCSSNIQLFIDNTPPSPRMVGGWAPATVAAALKHASFSVQNASLKTLSLLSRDFLYFPNVISETLERELIKECSRALRKADWCDSHFDSVIVGYRETTVSDLTATPQIKAFLANEIIPRFFINKPLLPVHILELSRDGYIKPHLDNVWFDFKLPSYTLTPLVLWISDCHPFSQIRKNYQVFAKDGQEWFLSSASLTSISLFSDVKLWPLFYANI